MQWRRITEELTWKNPPVKFLGEKESIIKKVGNIYSSIMERPPEVSWRASWGLNLESTAVPWLQGVAYCWQLWLGLHARGHDGHANHPRTAVNLSRAPPLHLPDCYSVSNRVELHSRSHPRGLHSREEKLSLKACKHFSCFCELVFAPVFLFLEF